MCSRFSLITRYILFPVGSTGAQNLETFTTEFPRKQLKKWRSLSEIFGTLRLLYRKRSSREKHYQQEIPFNPLLPPGFNRDDFRPTTTHRVCRLTNMCPQLLLPIVGLGLIYYSVSYLITIYRHNVLFSRGVAMMLFESICWIFH